ncbi:MAG: sigma factor-like helix-turn-helix DNA-binding protein [Egibacteraceae bacterium]
MRELRNVGPQSVRQVVGACLDLALFALLPPEHRCTSLRALLGELADLLDDRSWLVLCLRQVSLVEHCSGPELARQLALSSSRIQQLERLAAGRLREALGDIRFRPVVDVAERLRARLGDGPVPVGEATASAGALTPPAEPPLDERGSELLLWCAGPHRAAPGSLVVAGGPTPEGHGHAFRKHLR